MEEVEVMVVRSMKGQCGSVIYSCSCVGSESDNQLKRSSTFIFGGEAAKVKKQKRQHMLGFLTSLSF